MRPRGADHRRGAVHPGPAGAARRRAARPPTRCTRGSPSRARTSWPSCTCGTTCATQQRELSSSAFRRMCRREYLHYLRVREWQDVYGQLRQAAADLGITPPGAARHRRARPGAAAAERTGPAAQGQDRPRRAGPACPRPRPVRDAEARHLPGRPGRPGPHLAAAGLLSHIGMRDTDQKAAREAAAADRVRRGARRPVRHLPGLVAGPEAAAVGDRHRTGRDVAAVGPDRGPDRAGVGRAAGRAPGPALLQRAALGRPARRGDGHWRRSPCTACRS